MVLIKNILVPNLTKNLTAHGSYGIFVVFRQISVKRKFHRAHPTFDLGHYPALLTRLENLCRLRDVHRSSLSDQK